MPPSSTYMVRCTLLQAAGLQFPDVLTFLTVTVYTPSKAAPALPSWIWMSSSSTGRRSQKHGVIGNVLNHAVMTANCIATRTVLLLMVGLAIGCFYVVALLHFAHVRMT